MNVQLLVIRRPSSTSMEDVNGESILIFALRWQGLLN
jgi:hypothetical protein